MWNADNIVVSRWLIDSRDFACKPFWWLEFEASLELIKTNWILRYWIKNKLGILGLITCWELLGFRLEEGRGGSGEGWWRGFRRFWFCEAGLGWTRMIWACENLRGFRILEIGPFISSPVLDRLRAFSYSPVGEKLEISMCPNTVGHGGMWIKILDLFGYKDGGDIIYSDESQYIYIYIYI